MNIAFLIMGNSNYDFLPKLIQSLSDGENDFYIHINANSNIENFRKTLIQNQHLFWSNKRFKTHWGGYSILEASIDLLRESYKSKVKYDYFFFLTESDYPIKSNSTIKSIIAEKNPLIAVYNISKGMDKGQRLKIQMYHYCDLTIANIVLGKWLRRIIKGFMIIGYYTGIAKKPNYYIDNDGKKHDVYFGSDFGLLSRRDAECVLNEFDNDSSLKKYLKHAFVPGELFIPTVLMKNETTAKDCIICEKPDLKAMTKTHFYKVIQNHRQKSIKILTEDDYDVIKECKYFFARKMKMGVSDILLSQIDTLRNEQPR